MKKLILLFVLMSVCLNAQKFILTPQNLVNADDNTKNYVVLDFPDKKQTELYKAAKLYLNTIYNNPKFVTSEVENEQIVINAKSPNVIRLKGAMNFDVNYQAIFSFKDNKMKVELSIKDYERFYSTFEKQPLIGFDMGISKTGIFNTSGKLINEKGKISTEAFANNYIQNIKEAIQKSSTSSDW